jgi:hypothetical protein
MSDSSELGVLFTEHSGVTAKSPVASLWSYETRARGRDQRSIARYQKTGRSLRKILPISTPSARPAPATYGDELRDPLANLVADGAYF